MSDDGFHEIQLNGKQLVFLFMAATVVSVVIFLCGVMVGRGVRADRADGASAVSDLATSPAAQASSGAASAPPATPLPASEPPNPHDDESVQNALTEKNPKDTKLVPAAKDTQPLKPPAAAAAPAPKPAAVEKPAAEKAAPAEKPAPAHADAGASKPPAQIAPPAAPGTVASGGFAVQITALRDRGEADAIVKRLAAKGYPAYVLNPLPGKPPVYRVQVGRFPERAEADRIASRLQKEEQFSPWVTR
jgi:cell division septation protein DedD